MSSLREVHLGIRERREVEGSSSTSVLSFVGECEMHWRMDTAIVETLIAY